MVEPFVETSKLSFRLACAICQTEETVDVVCHHCGRPLCSRHTFPLRDRAFHRSPAAAHCPDCLLSRHFPLPLPGLRYLLVHFDPLGNWLRALTPLDPPAEEPEATEETAAAPARKRRKRKGRFSRLRRRR